MILLFFLKQKIGNVDKDLMRKFIKIKDVVRKMLYFVFLIKKKDYKQLRKLRMQFSEFLNGVRILKIL